MDLHPEPYSMIVGDAVEALAGLEAESVDLALTDIPYGISLDDWDVLHANRNSALGGSSPGQERLGDGFRRRGKPINGWSRADMERPREYQAWCATWAAPLARSLKPGASLLMFCGRRTQHRAVAALEDAGLLVRDMLAWEKTNAHRRAQSLSRLFRRRGLEREAEAWEGWRLGNLAPRFEPIVWMFRPYKLGGTIADNVLRYGVGAMNAAAGRDESAGCGGGGEKSGAVGTEPSGGRRRRRHERGGGATNVLRFDMAPDEPRYHEAQKPEALLAYLIRLTTRPGQLVVDPFAGSGSTGVAAVREGRRFVGVEQSAAYAEIARTRLERCALHSA